MKKQVTPYKESEQTKKEQVAGMFDNIAHKYDFLNHFFSMGIDIRWRKKAVKLLQDKHPKKLLDIATGTGDFALSLLKLKPEQIIGVDISEGMMEMGRVKVKQKNVDNIISFQYGDSENLPFEDNTFDAITVGFGVRNFENLKKGLADMCRVLNSNGRVAILEFSQPKRFPIKQLYGFYFKNIMPVLGKIVSKDSAAYTYLPESVYAFPDGQDFIKVMEEVGFKSCKAHPVSGGIATIYIGEK